MINKKALVMSGGGVKGAHTVGALRYLINDLNKQYDIICGVSVGALNAGCLSMYKKQYEKQGFEYLFNFWQNLTVDKIYKRWFPFGKLHALWKQSVYNSQPLIDLIHNNIKLDKIRESEKNVAVGAISLTTGHYKLFTEKDDDFVDGVLASSSFPGGLKPIKIGNELFTDGGVKHITPLKAAIDFGATEVDMILCSPQMDTDIYDENGNTISLVLRSISLMTDQIVEADLQIAQMYNKLVLCGARPDKRFVKINIIRPNKNLINDSLRFNNKEIVKMMELGYLDAKEQYEVQ